MSTPSKLFEQMELAEASYVLFDPSVYNNQEHLEAYLKNRHLEGKFSAAQATEFITHWKVKDHLPDTTSGFSATLFESLDNPGQLTLAFRGSNPDWLLTDFVGTDVGDVILDGLALDQIVDMYNYVQRLKASVGSTYTVARLENYNALTDALREAYVYGNGAELEAQYAAQGYIVDRPTLTVRRVGFTLSSQADGLELIIPGQTITVTGHSLGGHLAMAFTRLFNNATAYTTNTLGFAINANVTNLFSALGGQTGFDAARIMNVYGEAGPEIVTGNPFLGLHQPGTRFPLFTEDWRDPTLGHASEFMTDSAAVYDLFFQMDTTLALKPLPEAVAIVNGTLGSGVRLPKCRLQFRDVPQ